MAKEDRDTLKEPGGEKEGDGPQAAATLGIEDAMARLALGRAQVYRLVKDDILKADKNDAQIAFSECDLAAAAGELAKRRENVAELLRILASQLAEHGIEDLSETSADDIAAAVGEAANWLVLCGIAARASDVYVMPCEEGDRYLARIGGRLQELVRVERELGDQLKEKLKAMAPLSDADGEEIGAAVFRHAHENWSAQVRLSVLPTAAGEQVHLQFFTANVGSTLDAIGYTARQREDLQELLAGKSGLFVLSGSRCRHVEEQRLALAAFLSGLGKLVVALDRTPNFRSEGVIHLDSRHAADIDCADPWQTAMGLNPDAIMVDQVEGSEQAGRLLAALAAGITVLVHVEHATAAGGLTALAESGLGWRALHRYFRAAAEFVSIPRLCPDCREPRAMRADEAQTLGEPKAKHVYSAVGCEQCDGGFLGSRAVWGLLLADDLEITDSLDGETLLKQADGETFASDTSLAAALRSAVLAGDTTFDCIESFLR